MLLKNGTSASKMGTLPYFPTKGDLPPILTWSSALSNPKAGLVFLLQRIYVSLLAGRQVSIVLFSDAIV